MPCPDAAIAPGTLRIRKSYLWTQNIKAFGRLESKMLPLGEWMELEAVRRFDFGVVFRDPEGEGEALLPAGKVPHNLNLGDKLNLFVHLDSHQRPVLTDEEPPMILDQVACLRVKDIRDQGAFLEWLSDRDLFLPYAEMPKILRIGQRIWVQLQLDERSDRLMAATRLDRIFPMESNEFETNQEVRIKVFRRTQIGWQALINDEVVGLMLFQDIFGNPDWSVEHDGYIKSVREDGKLDLAMRPQGFRQVIDLDRQGIVRALQNAPDNFLPITDKSTPEEVYEHLRMSKKAFKKALGGLWKDGEIDLYSDGIALKGI